MEHTLTIEEKYSNYWLQLTAALVLVTLIFFGLYSTSDDLLWKGYLRLIAFCSMAGAVISGLKVMQGKHTIELAVSDGNLVITYIRKKKRVAEDIFELANFKSLQVRSRPTGRFGSEFLFKDRVITMELTDSDRPLTLVELHGRPLALSRESATKILEFLEAHAPGIGPEDLSESGRP